MATFPCPVLVYPKAVASARIGVTARGQRYASKFVGQSCARTAKLGDQTSSRILNSCSGLIVCGKFRM